MTDGRWVKGQSGNPGGRPTLPAELRDSLRKLTPKALEVLELCLHSPDLKIAMTAANSILDRAYGRSTTVIDKHLTRDNGAGVSHDDYLVTGEQP